MSRKKVGLLLESVQQTYSRAFVASLEQKARNVDVDLKLVRVDWALTSSADVVERAEEAVAAAGDLDAMILLSAVFTHGVAGLSKFAQRWAPRPMVSVGYRLHGTPSIVVDNRNGMRSAATHLIEVHGRRKLLFLRGRRDSQEAEDRYLGFRHALRDHGIFYDEKLTIQGDFTRVGVLRALSSAPEDIEFDGVVSANDDMALAVLSELRRKGKEVPKDIAIVGFDDVPEAKQAEVPLSSFAQPFDGMARVALDSLLAQSNQLSVPQVQNVEVGFVARKSCGCH
jgi:DNA-binding LacI/PurR family transcriptional regulator